MTVDGLEIRLQTAANPLAATGNRQSARAGGRQPCSAVKIDEYIQVRAPVTLAGDIPSVVDFL
jgi:hypothetical protein